MDSAPPLLGDTLLNQMNGFDEYCGPMLKLWFAPACICETSPGTAAMGGNESNSMLALAVLVCSSC